MKRKLLAILSAGCLAALLVLAAPALSLRPYVPEPVSFERSVPLGASAAGRGSVTSPKVRAPRRFNLVGLRWHGREEASLSVRTRTVGGRWSGWRSLDAEAHDGPDPSTGERSGGLSAPVWAGEADAVQFRASRPLSGARLHFVNTTGTASAGERVRTAVRRSVHNGVLAVSGLLTARAQGSQPAIVSRSAWGADRYCKPRRTPGYGTVKGAFIHHTVSTNNYSAAQGPAAVLAICQYHRNSNGWDDIGYNFLVDRYGAIYEGRAGGMDQAVVGAQAQGFNNQSTGISNIGTYTSVPQSDEAMNAMARLLRWKLPVHGVPTSGTTTYTSAGGASNRYRAGTVVTMNRISGHRDGNNTACPGESLYAQLPALRARAGAPAGTAARLRLRRPRSPIAVGRVVRVSGRLKPAKPVVYIAVERRVRGRYRRAATLRADATSGRFVRGYRLRKRGTYRVWAAFGGDSEHPRLRTRKAYIKAYTATGGATPTRRRR